MGSCFICNNVDFKKARVPDYLKCAVCGHEQKKGGVSEHFIVNDVLSLKEVEKKDALERFRVEVVSACARSYDFILDVGSASGKFLFHVKDRFKKHLGIEITKACVDFAREKLRLTISERIDDIQDENISVVTFWHSLEHIPEHELSNMLRIISARSTSETALIIAVPNADSTLYKMSGKHFSYYDPYSHVHQFSYASLLLLMKKCGFEQKRMFFSFAYSSFGYLQSMLNLVNVEHNFLYYYLKRGKEFGKNRTALFLRGLYNVTLCTIFLLPAVTGTLYDFLSKKRGAVLTICFQKKH